MRLRDEAGLATGQAGSASGRRSASWRFLGLTLAATVHNGQFQSLAAGSSVFL